MPELTRSIVIAAPIEEVFHFHDDPANLLLITPPDIRIELLEQRGDAGVGKRVRMRMTQFGFLRQELTIEFMAYRPYELIIDEQREGPFRLWRQIRWFRSVDGGTELTDRVEYEVPFGILGRMADALLIRRRIERMFLYRQSRLQELLEEKSFARR